MNCEKVSKKTAITWLDKEKVFITKNKFCTGCGCEAQLGNSEIINFENNEESIKKLRDTLEEPFLSAVLAVWEVSTTNDSETEKSDENPKDETEDYGEKSADISQDAEI